MFLYNINEDKLEEIKEIPFKKEIELHKLCESNLDKVFGLKFVRREFAFNNFRMEIMKFKYLMMRK